MAMSPAEQARMNELERKVRDLENVTFPAFIANARLRIVEPELGEVIRKQDNGNTVGISKSVVEAGTSTYNVAKEYDASLIVEDIDGNRYKIGVYNV